VENGIVPPEVKSCHLSGPLFSGLLNAHYGFMLGEVGQGETFSIPNY